MRRLVILYGGVADQFNGKQQRMIDGLCTCGYRAYAKRFGDIIYLNRQNVREKWEHSIVDINRVIEFISRDKDAVVWSVKHDIVKDKILKRVSNFKLYYSCCSRNMYNNYCDFSLVDDVSRMCGNTRLFVKGKDSNYWCPGGQCKEFDYLLIGRRADKNEILFLEKLNSVMAKRRVLWIGGIDHKDKVRCRHEVIFTDFLCQDAVRDNIPRAKVGILFTEHPAEGFPQSFLEMTMCGVPVVYNKHAPGNVNYFFEHNSMLVSKSNLISGAESLLGRYNPVECRKVAIEHYDLDVSYGRMIDA